VSSLGERVRAGERLVGTVLTLPGAVTAELLAEPFDVVWIDLEHGALGPAEAQELILGAQAAGTYALVRLRAEDQRLMAASLDAGADGVVLAAVEDAETARAAVARAEHPPLGVRGYGPRRLSLRGRGNGSAGPARPSIWVQVESAAGVERAGEIASVAGVDAVVMGTADLSFSVGTPLDTGAPELVAAVVAARTLVRTATSPVAFGLAGALDGPPTELLAGATVLVHSTDARLSAGAVDGAARRLRAFLSADLEEAVRP
jgi:2-keto-3-deoxy-L-rhamnonate aldolase RhmA